MNEVHVEKKEAYEWRLRRNQRLNQLHVNVNVGKVL